MKTERNEHTVILDGRALSTRLRIDMAERVRRLEERGRTPGLSVVLVGDDPASQIYVAQKEKGCAAIGIRSLTRRLPADTTADLLLESIHELNGSADVHGILVQLPLPAGIDATSIIEAIKPEKDVDGLHPMSMGRLLAGTGAMLPCTPHGIVKLMEAHGIGIEGKEAVVVGRSTIVGKPLALMLLQRNATVTLCHSRTRDLARHTRRADILVAAVGHAGLITGEMVKNGVVVIDVAMNRDSQGKLRGDVNFDEVAPRASAITPVPGGVGPMTITMLLDNTIRAAESLPA